jgi:dienelactone hydrolase
MSLRAIDYQSDGVRLRGYLANGGEGIDAPGVLVAHEAPGVGDHVKARAERLADLGYVAFALDLYGQEGFPLEESMTRHTELMSAPGLLFKRANAALELLSDQQGVDRDRLAAIGFCQGGVTVLELARGGAPIRCAVGFHPGLMRPAGSLDAPIKAKVLMMVGDRDPVVPSEDRAAFAAEMTAKGADWQLHVFGGVGHTYTNPAIDALGRPGFAYNKLADHRSWAMMLALLDEEFNTQAGD